jgi:hypothetical protein
MIKSKMWMGPIIAITAIFLIPSISFFTHVAKASECSAIETKGGFGASVSSTGSGACSAGGASGPLMV